MVRLKGMGFLRICMPYQVSIPYGTIKSPQQGDPNKPPLVFQFLMVRLKD